MKQRSESIECRKGRDVFTYEREAMINQGGAHGDRANSRVAIPRI